MDMDLLGITIGMIGIGVGIFLTYDKTRKNIEKILERDFEGHLAKNQAISLGSLYITMVRRELRYQVNHFFEFQFQKYKEIETPEAMQNVVYGKFRHCINDIRQRFQPFKLKGGLDFLHAVESIDAGDALDAKNAIFDIVAWAHKEPNPNIELIKSKIFLGINKANDAGGEALKKYIHRVY